MDKCEMELCHRKARYAIRDIKTGKWLNVCGIHDNFLGVRNLELQGETRLNAMLINREVKSHVD